MGLWRLFAKGVVVVVVVVAGLAGVVVVGWLSGVEVVGEGEVVVEVLVVGVVGEEVVGGGVVVVVVLVVVFLVIGVEAGDEGVAELVVLWWPWCLCQCARANAWRCLLVHGVFFLFFCCFLLLLFLFFLLGAWVGLWMGPSTMI